jgi:uncharacterized protein (DUF1697 family)
MNKYICLLRGINVGGHNKIKMVDLKIALEKANLKNIETYIQSGNIVFESEEKNLENKIAKSIKENFKLEIKVMVISFEEFEKTIKDNPFQNEDPKFSNISFLSNKPDLTLIDTLLPYLKNEKIKLNEKALYIFYTDGQAKTKLTNNIIESKLNVTATNRNLNTCNKLIEMGNEFN